MSFADKRKTSQGSKSTTGFASMKRSEQEIQRTASQIREARDLENFRAVSAGNLMPNLPSRIGASAPQMQFSEPIQIGKRSTTPTQIYEEAIEVGTPTNLDKAITSTLQKKAQIQQQLNTYSFENNGVIDQTLANQLKSLEAEVDRLENIRSEQAGAAAQKAQQDKIKSYVDKSGLGDKYFTQSNLKARQAELEKEKKRLENELAKMGANTYDAMLDTDGKQLAEKDRVSKELEDVKAEMRFIANSYSGLRDADTQHKVTTTAQSQYEARRTADSVLDAVAKLLDAPHAGISAAEQNDAVQKIESATGLSLNSFGGDVQAFARAAQSRAVTGVAEAKKAWEKAGLSSEEYASMVRMESNKAHQRASAANAEKITEFAEAYPTLASVLSIVASPAQGVDFINQTLRYAEGSNVSNLDTYVPADSSHMTVTNFVTGIRSTVGGRLADQYTAEVLDQNVAEFLYNTGMSAADSMAQVATFGPASIYVMGLSSAANTAKAVIDSGGTNGQAFAMGIAAGVAEALCEKVSVDKLLDMLTADNVESIAQAIGKVLSQTGSEASEEFITEIANAIAEAYIMEGESAFRKKVADYSKNMEERDAVNKALGDVLIQAGISGIAGALSGFVSGAAAMGAHVVPTAEGALPWVAPKKAARKVTTTVETASPAAAPEVQQLTQQAEATKQQNPEVNVLDAATTLFVNEQGCNLKTAEIRAGIVQKLVAGENVSDKDLKRIEPTSKITQRIFTQLTGVQFPEGPAGIEKLMPIFRTAHEVAVQAQQAQVQMVQQEAPITSTGVAERVAQAQQVAEQVAPETDDVVSFEDFTEQAQQIPEMASLPPEVLEVAYAQWLQDTGVTVAVNGEDMSFAGFVNYLRSTPEGVTLTVGEMGRQFQQLANQQNMNKEANYGGQNLLHGAGLSGQPDQRSGGQSRSVPETAGRAEGKDGTRRGDQSGSQAGRSGEVRSAGQNQEGTGSYRTVKVNGNPMTEVRPEAYTPEMRDLVDQYAAIGVNAHIVIEGYPMDAEGHYADGITIFNTDGTTDVFLQVVGAHAMPERSDHEKAHVVLGRSPAVKEQAIAALGKAMSEKELLELVNAYLPMYGSAYANSEDLVGDLLEEIICDAYANLDRANAGAPKYRDAVRGVIEAQLQSYSASYGQDVTLTDDAGNLVVESDGNGRSTFSMSTYQDSGRDILTQWMGKAVVNGDLTQQDADDIINTMDLIYDICEEARGDYAPFDAWSEAKVVVNEQGNPVFSVVKANGDYAMNLDFSLVCKKRRTLDAVLNELVKQGFVDNLALNEKQIVKINDLIRSYGFEVACDLCFVDAKRYRQGKVADDFVKLYNGLVQSMIPKGSGLKPAYFNFGQSTVVDNTGLGIHELTDDQLDFTKIEKVLKEKGEKSVEYKTAMLLKTSPADRKLTMRGDFLSTRGFDELNLKNPRVLKLFNSKKGSGGPKSAVSDVQYLNEVLTSKTFTPEKAYAVGGVRIQSFSDYVPRMVFDYVQMIADLAAKKLPAHAYTKEELFVKQFGLTGMKINMSLIPKVVDGGIAPGLDADGNYAWADESFNFDEAKKIQKAEGYSRNCGTIAVGVSDEHIRKLMADPEIRMVIPYHKSGLNPVVAKMNKIEAFVNYTEFQNTRRPNGKNGKKLDKDIAADKKLLNEMPDFNTKMRELGDPRAAAEFYVRWCEDNNLLPKFDQFAYKTIDGMLVEKDGKRVVDENYYKLLEDFTVYDKGKYVEQTGLTMTFPTEDSAFGDMKSLIKRGLSEDALLEAKRDADVPKIVNDIKQMKFSAAGWKPNLDSAEWDIVKSVMNNGRGTAITTIDKMFFESTKGKSVFGIYSTDDDTLLYASRGEDAVREHQFVEFVKEEFENGGLTDTSTKGIRALAERARMQSVGNSGDNVTVGGSDRLGRHAGLDGRQPRFHASGALENVLTNILKAEETRRANSVIEQPTQASEESGAFNLDSFTIDDLLNLSDAEFEKLYDALGLDFDLELDDNILLEDDFDLEDIAEELGGEPEKIEILFRRKGLGDDYVAPEKQAVMTEKRIDERIHDSGAGSHPDYARKYITRIRPTDFIDLTVSEANLARENFDTRVHGDSGSVMGDWDYEQALHDSAEPPALDIDFATGQIVGHNGRHRMRALEMAGIESVEIEVAFYDEDGYLKKYGAETIPDLAISSQFDTKIETHLSHLIPLNKAHRDEIMQSYGEKAHTKAKVKYSVIDSSGRSLTEDQQKYFTKSKARDYMGRLMTMFHGTKSFGFTVFDPEFSDDGISLFFTDRPETSRSYTGTRGNDIRAISKNTDLTAYQYEGIFSTDEEAWDYLELLGYRKVTPEAQTVEQLLTARDTTIEIAVEEAKHWLDTLEAELPGVIPEARMSIARRNSLTRLRNAIAEVEDLRNNPDPGSSMYEDVLFGAMSELFDAEQACMDNLTYYRDYTDTAGRETLDGLKDVISDPDYSKFHFDRLLDAVGYNQPAYIVYAPGQGAFHLSEAEIRYEANKERKKARKGLYEVYLNLENPLIIDAARMNWNELSYEDLADYGDNGDRYWEGETTREIAEWAKENGYDGVIFRDVYDVGFHATGDESAATVMIAFKSEQVKSTANEHPTTNPDIRYSVTPAFEKWYQETYNEELTNSQLKRRLQTAERRAEQAEHNRKAAELKNTFDKEMNLTAWMMHHTKKMREQKRTMNEKLAEARKEKTEAVKAAVAETKEIERAKAAVQHDADRMAERRNAAKRLRIREDAYKQKVTEMKENQKLKRNAARAVLRDSKLAAKRRAEIEAEQGLVDTIRKNPKQRTGVEKLQDAAQVLRTLGRSTYRNFVNMAEAIDRFSKRQAEGMRAGTLVNILGGTASTVESMFKKGLVDRAGNRIGESMSDVFLCWDEAHKNVNEELQAVLQDFMLHRHNIDRMSIVARAESALETFENTHEWLRDMDPKEFARLVAMTEKEAEKSGKQQAQLQAVQYARLIREYNEAQNKPIFADDKGNPVTAETSQKMVDKYIAENPWLLEKANGIYEWWDKFMREWAVGDTISEAEYSRMRQMYPHYVPTYRTTHNGVGGAGFVGNGAASVSKAVKKAKGSTEEVMNIEDSFSNLVSKIVRLNRLNEMYMNIVDTAMLDEDGLFSDMAYFDWDWQDGAYANALITGSADIADLTDTVAETEKTGLEKVGPDEYKLTAWRNGRKYTAYISKDLYQSIGMVTGHLANDLEEGLLKVGNALTGPMKTAITGINPTFAVRNLSRDLPTAIINSISGLAFPKYYAQAAKEIAQNSEHWQQFQALGGTNATYYNDSQGRAKAMAKGKNLGSKAVGAMGAFNEVTESQTRFAEYLATVDKLGDTYENRLQGIKNAAEVTVDFSRKGRYGKVINAWVPYWNPAVQGIDKTVRSLIESPDGAAVWKQASRTLGRAAMTTILFEAIQYAVLKALGRDDEWEELNDRTKDTYYCIPLKDSKTFLKIPKNREWGAILGTPFMRMLEYANGREDPFENYIETSIEPNFLPPAIFRPDAGGGFTSDIIGVSQALDLAKNEDFAGRTIVPYSYQQGTLSQQYDSETSWFAKQLGDLLNWSPMQIDYILGDYFGDFGRMFIQATSKATLTGEQNLGKAALDIVTNPFVADARYSSYAVNKYYDLMDELDRVVQDRKNQLGTDGAKETLEYQTQKAVDTLYGKAITELNREVREMADGPEKDAAKEQIAQLAADAVEFYNDSISGKIPQPELTANYANYSQVVSNELIQMNELAKEYNFKPRTSAPESYVDPRNKKNEFVLTEEQQEYYMELYTEAYDEAFERVIQSSRYKNAKPERKAAMLEDVKQDVADTAKEELIDWLRKNGIRSTPKK